MQQVSNRDFAGVYRTLFTCSVMATILWIEGVVIGISPDTRNHRTAIVLLVGASYLLAGWAGLRWITAREHSSATHFVALAILAVFLTIAGLTGMGLAVWAIVSSGSLF